MKQESKMADIFDTLASYKRLQAVGFDQPKAEEITDLISESISGAVATKADIELFAGKINTVLGDQKTEIKEEISAVEEKLTQKIDGVGNRLTDEKAELKEDIQGVDKRLGDVRVELKEDIQGVDKRLTDVKAELKADIQGVDKKLTQKIDGVDKNLNNVRSELSAQTVKLLMWIFGMFFTFGSGLFFVLLKLVG